MKRVQTPNFTSNLLLYNAASVKALERDVESSNEAIFGGTCKGGKWAWLVRGQSLEVINTTTGDRQAAWCFGRVTGNTSITISCVKEYHYNHSTKFLVGLKYGSSDGMLCVFDPNVSKVITAVSVPYGISTIEPVTNVGGVRAPNYMLCAQLNLFFGIVAVGTDRGYIYLIDMRLDDVAELSDEGNPSSFVTITTRTQDVAEKRISATRRGEHLAFLLDESTHKRSSFNFCEPGGTVIRSFYASEVAVTALRFIKQTGTLTVGYSFGCFQLWRMVGPVLEYSSPLERFTSPLTHFAYQEPHDDPRYFCYLWVCKGPRPSDPCQESPVSLYMFQLVFGEREMHDGHGHLYKVLASCNPSFRHEVTADPYRMGNANSVGSRLFTCCTLENEFSPDAVKHEDSIADEVGTVSHNDLSLVLFAWEAPSGGPGSQTCCFLAVFDLNRYYHAQMPVSVNGSQESHDVCPYFSFCSLESVMETAAPDVLLDVFINPYQVSKFYSCATPAHEQHLYPSSFSFTATCLMETGVVTSQYLGAQRQVLADINRHGAVVLREPQEYFNLCWVMGLLPRTIDQPAATMSVQMQRESLLTVALENNMADFITMCITQYSEGGFSTGFTLRSILDWAWNKVANIKESLDRICIPLYDGYGTHLDQQTMQALDQNALQLNHMVLIFQALLDQSGSTTEQGLRDLETKLNVVSLICHHLHLVLWFVRNGLLPEFPDDLGEPLAGQFCYPAMKLRKVYTNRRAELQRLCGSSDDIDILLIDGIVSQIGAPLHMLWCKEEGGTGKYPPPSLHGLLDIYLLEGVDPMMKHCIVTYLLLDMNGHPQQEKFIDQAFPKSFSLPLGMIKLLEGFWLLDHKLFEEALNRLLDPVITMNVSPWQHSRIIKAFLYQGESQKALQYIRTKQPAMETLNDVKLHLSVLLTNGLTAEAFHFQRLYRDQENAEELLYHLFLGAQQTKTVDNLLKLPLSQMEESTLISYLKDSTEPNSVELLVMHYLQRARYVEAIRLNETLKHSLMSETDIKARERASARNAIVDSYTKLLPRVQRKLAYAPEQPMRKLTMARREVIRPKPLSTVVNRSGKSQVISHATLLNAVLDKISEARCQTRDDETPIKRRLSESAPSITEADPFVGTPVTPRSKTVLSDKRSLVYPQIMYSEDSSPQMKPSSPRIQRLYSTSPQQSVNLSSPPMFMDQMKRRVSDFTSAAALSLLCTPPVRKRTPGSLRKTKTPQPTPQSILKVRKPIRTTSSPGEDISGPPSPAQESPDIKPKQLSAVFKGNITLETPPRFHRKKASFAVTVEPKPETPRHIRFAFDDKQDVSLKDENSLSLPEDSVMPSVEIANDSDAMATEADIVLNDNSDLELRLDESQDDSMVVDDEVSFHRRGDTSHRTMDDSEEMEEELTQEYQPAAEIKDTEEDVIEVEEVLHADEDEVAVLEDEVREVSPEDEDEDVVKEDVAIELVMEDSIPAQDVGAPSPKRESSPEMLILDESDEEEEEELPPLVARETDEEKKFEEDADILEVPEERKVEEKSTTDEKTQKEDFVMEQQDLLRAEEPVSEAVAVQFEKQETRPEADTEISQDVVEVESEGTDQTEVTVPEELIETRPGKVEDDGTTEVDAEQRYATTDETLTVLPEKTPVLQPQELPVSPEAGDVPAMMTTPKRPPPKIQATVFEMGVQTTPGLSLRQPHRMGTPSYADAFRASLRSERRIRRRKLPDGTEKAPDSSVPEVEVTIPEVSETAASVSETAPWVSEPETSVSETPDPASTDTDTVMETTTDDASVMQTTEDETGEESKTEDDVEEMAYTFSEPLTLSKNEDSVAATPTSGTSSTPRFVFSPPLTRSQLRRKQRLDTPESSGAGDGSSPGLPFLSAEMKEGKSSSASRRVTRTRKSSRLSLQPPSDSPINFISPVVSELASNANKRKTRRSIRIASSKSLLDEPLVEEKTTTTKVRRAKTRSGKLWSNV